MNKPLFIVAGVLAVGIFLIVRGFNNRPVREPRPPALVIRYSPSVCADAFDQPDLDRGAFTGNNFVVDLHEGCFHEVVIMPKTPQWREWHFRVDDRGSDCWYALWGTGKKNDSGVIYCSGNRPNIYFDSTPAFRLQGREGVHMRFYNSAWTK